MQTEDMPGVLVWLGVAVGYAWAVWRLGRLGRDASEEDTSGRRARGSRSPSMSG